ncbi:MAG: hypothetical protein V1867_04810 [Candidatus Falkowbacteria bacterium]
MENLDKIKSADFVVKPEKIVSRNATQIVAAEMIDDISVFSDEDRVIVEKKLVEDEPLDAKEQKKFDQARSAWWYNKYGFSYTMKEARQETLLRKYESDKKAEEERISLQQELFLAFKDGDSEQIAKLKERYEGEFPDQCEGIAALFGLADYLKIQEKLYSQDTIERERRGDMIKGLTEYQFLLAHFISLNGQNKEFLRIFWEVMEKSADACGELKQFNVMRQGVLSQVATFKIFEALGANPKLSHPREDAFEAIDMWSDDKNAIQVKSNKRITEPMIVEADSVVFPGIETKKEGDNNYYNSKYFSDMQRFKGKLKQYGLLLGKELKGYLLVVPTAQFDFITGEPSEKIVEFVREHINRKKEEENNN